MSVITSSSQRTLRQFLEWSRRRDPEQIKSRDGGGGDGGGGDGGGGDGGGGDGGVGSVMVAQRWGNIGPALIRNLSRRKIAPSDEGVTQPVYGFGSTESSFRCGVCVCVFVCVRARARVCSDITRFSLRGNFYEDTLLLLAFLVSRAFRVESDLLRAATSLHVARPTRETDDTRNRTITRNDKCRVRARPVDLTQIRPSGHHGVFSTCAAGRICSSRFVRKFLTALPRVSRLIQRGSNIIQIFDNN